MSPLHVFIRKLIMIIPTVLLLSFLSFSVIYFAPGSAEKLLLNAKNARGFISDKTVDVYGKKLGLNKPFGRLYAHWLCSLLKGDLGTSYLTNKPVSGIFIKRFSVTFKLALLSLLIYSALGIPIGVLASVKENILCRFFLQRWRIICMSIPSFWIAVILVWFLCRSYGSGIIRYCSCSGNTCLIGTQIFAAVDTASIRYGRFRSGCFFKDAARVQIHFFYCAHCSGFQFFIRWDNRPFCRILRRTVRRNTVLSLQYHSIVSDDCRRYLFLRCFRKFRFYFNRLIDCFRYDI